MTLLSPKPKPYWPFSWSDSFRRIFLGVTIKPSLGSWHCTQILVLHCHQLRGRSLCTFGYTVDNPDQGALSPTGKHRCRESEPPHTIPYQGPPSPQNGSTSINLDQHEYTYSAVARTLTHCCTNLGQNPLWQNPLGHNPLGQKHFWTKSHRTKSPKIKSPRTKSPKIRIR